MKLAAILLLATCLQVAAKGYAQNDNITLRVQKASLSEALHLIKEKTEYTFLYKNENLQKGSRKVDIDIKKGTIQQVMDACLKGFPLSYKLIGETIIITSNRSGELPASTEIAALTEQPRQIKGVVTDSLGTPMAGVSVTIKGTKQGTLTDNNGKFELNIPTDAVLQFAYVGYQSQEVAPGDRQNLQIRLLHVDSKLDQIVVVGYGTQKKADLTGSITSLSAADLDAGVSTSFDQLLKGKAAGVQVVQNSSEPGGGLSISIRGASSINAGTGPLYVIDGLPIDNSAVIRGTGSEYVATPTSHNPLSTINPADIASIEILKDASATAIYGSRGANGVILVTTKKGKSGAMKVSYNTNYGLQNVANKIDLLNPTQYKTVLNELIDAGAASEENRVTGATGGTDWQSAIFQKDAKIMSHNLAFTGGNEKSHYYISLNYFDQDGVIKSSAFRRYNARVNLVTQAAKNFEVGLNLSTTYNKDDYVPVGFGINGESGIMYAALNFDPTLSLYDAEGNYSTSSFLDMDNPLALAYGSNALASTYRTFGTIYAKYQVIPGLNIKLNLGGDILHQRKDVYVSRLTRHGKPQGGVGTILQGEKSNYLVEATADYVKSWGDHRINALLGATTQRFVTTNTNMTASQFPSDATGTDNLGLGTQSTYGLGSGKSANRLLSYLGRINYAYKNKYLLTASFRADGSSRFGTNNRFGYFPSFAAAWKLKEEDFLKSNNLFSDLKLRASWGRTGNQEIGDYAALTTFGIGAPAILDDEPVTSTAPARLPNPRLKWETTEQTDIGLDFGLLKGRITGAIDYFSKRTFNMLLNLPVPTSTGFASRLSNVGSIRNHGWEFTLNTINIDRALNWSTNITLSTIRNKVLNLGEIKKIITGGAGQTSEIFLIEPGSPLYSFYGYRIDGIWQKDDDFSTTRDNVQPGDFKYADINGDGTVNASDRVILGNSFPKLTWSLGNSLSYKHFNLDIFLEGSQGVSMLNNNLVDAYFPVQFRRNRFAEPYLNRWTADNPSTKYPSFINPTSQGNKLVNSYTVEDASYARIKRVKLSYTFDQPFKFIQLLNVFVTCENLYTFTDYDGYDPAVNPNGNVFQRIDFNAYPLARTFMAGISVNF